MARCFSCKKNFDYEKYYGICPKCGAYNRENTPEEEAEDLYGSQKFQKHQEQHKQHTVVSSAGMVIFVLLILGIIGTVVLPFLYFVNKSVNFSTLVSSDQVYEENALGEKVPEETEPGEEKKEEAAVQREPQTAEIIEGSASETCSLGKNGELKVVVGEARVLVLDGYVDGFPEGEKLVSITVYHNDMHEEYGDYSALDMLYVGYGSHTYKECMTSYDMEDYLNVLGNINITDCYNISYGEGEGEILVFVPEDTTAIDLYLESRNEDTYEIIEIYQIPLEIKSGEEI